MMSNDHNEGQQMGQTPADAILALIEDRLAIIWAKPGARDTFRSELLAALTLSDAELERVIEGMERALDDLGSGRFPLAYDQEYIRNAVALLRLPSNQPHAEPGGERERVIAILERGRSGNLHGTWLDAIDEALAALRTPVEATPATVKVNSAELDAAIARIRSAMGNGREINPWDVRILITAIEANP